MSVDATAAATAPTGIYSTPATTTAPPKQTLDSQAFLQLLVTQLTNQDPSSPMDTNQMMTQTTQLSSMEQLTALSATSRESFALQMRSSAAALIGQKVSYTNAKGVAVTGIATSVSFAASTPTVTVGSDVVPLDSVSAITSSSAPDPAPSPAPATSTTPTSSTASTSA